MNIKELQGKIKDFDIARGWENNWNIKDLLLNITEEGGEFWNLIKLVDYEITVPKLMFQKIAEEIEVTLDIEYKAYEK